MTWDNEEGGETVHQSAYAFLSQQHDENDERDRNAEKPEKNRHASFLPLVSLLDVQAMLRTPQFRSRKAPPSAAAMLDANAPRKSEAASQSASCEVALRAASRSAFASLTTSS